MIRLDISTEDICALARDKGLKEVCGYNITCQDSFQDAKRVYDISIVGIDGSLKKKKLFFTLTEWEELVQEDGNNQTQE